MEKRFTFAIDCDEVLRALLGNMVSLYNETFGENLQYDDVKEFKVEKSFPRIYELTGMTASRWFFQEHSEELFAKSSAFPEIKQDIETLQQYGDVIIVTYQKTYKNKIDTLNWLEEHGIITDGICFLKDKTLIHSDFLVDDNTWNFIGSHAKTGILITAPYNKDTDIEDLWRQSHCREMHRFDTLHDFVSWFVSEYVECGVFC
jgi:5'(3')-deoxyribonucleotidase